MQVFNKVVVITGSGQGLGKAFAVKLLESGAKVCLSDIKQETGDQVLIELGERFGREKVCFQACDVTREDEFKRLYHTAEDTFKANVDILVNNAGVEWSGWRRCMEVNIIGVMIGTEIAMDKMSLEKGGKGGLIVNTASMAGILPGFIPEILPYTVSKTGVVALTRTLGQAGVLKRTGVKVQCLCPTWADTEIVHSVTKKSAATDKLVKAMGIMTVEFVADGFMKLVTECGNGEVLGVMKNAPYFSIPDGRMKQIYSTAAAGTLYQKLTGRNLFLGWHQGVCLVGVLILVHLLLRIFSI